MREVLVVDSGWGNMHSIAHAVEELGFAPVVSDEPERVATAECAMLPGVGAFGKAADALWASGLADALRERAHADMPTLGICLGMQLLFDTSEESPGARGLGILGGCVCKISAPGLRVPHMGWNRLIREHPGRALPARLDAPYVYFVHSFAAAPGDVSVITASADYGARVPAIVERGAIWGMQFHPEKSGMDGMRILQHFLSGGEER